MLEKSRLLKRLKFSSVMLLAALWMTISCAFLAMAADVIDLDREVSLTLVFKDEKKPLVGAEFEMYQVGDISAHGTFSLSGDFSEYPVVVENLDNEEWRELAITLHGYVQRDHLESMDAAQTDELGLLKFPNNQDSLKPGLYLVIGKKHLQDGKKYTIEPFMAWLPDMNEVFHEWNYEVTAVPKQENTPDDGPGTITRKVLKVWNDKNYEKRRPSKVVVDLLQDGSVFDSVELNDDNNWRYTWEDLSDDCIWTLVERENKNYTVSVGKEGITFVVTNTYVPKKPGGGGGGGGGNTPDSPSDEPTVTMIEPPVPLAGLLPQTGQLWWPVPILIAVGLMFLIVGYMFGRGDNYEE